MIWIGTSGWQYRDWRGAFYPGKLAQRQWLEYHAARFRTVEINATFYRLPPPERFTAWANATPEDYVLCPKASRWLTHYKQLHDPSEPVARIMEGARCLGTKLGPILVQLSDRFRADPPRLARALDEFPSEVRLAVELRHASWWTEETRKLLAERDAALVLADRASKLITPPWRTAEWGYVRFHWGLARLQPCYGRRALDARAALLAQLYGGRDVFVFFNNDPRCCAVRDARLFALACRRHGLEPTRVPDAHDVRVVGA